MQKRFFPKAALAALFALLLFAAPMRCLAAEDALTEQLPKSVQQLMEGKEYADSSVLLQLLSDILRSFLGELSLPLAVLSAITALILLCGAAAGFFRAADSPAFRAFTLLCRCAGWILLFRMLSSALEQGIEGLTDTARLMSGCIPVVAGVMAASGSASGAALFVSVGSALCALFAAGLSQAVAAACGFLQGTAAVCALAGESFSKVVPKLTALLSRILVLVCGGFFAFLRLQSGITAAQDQLAVKAGSAVLQSAIPVLGGTLSQSAAMVAAGLSAARQSSAVLLVAAVLALMLPRLLQLLVLGLVLDAAGFLAELMSAPLGSVIRCFRGCVSLMAAVQAAAAVLFVLLTCGVVAVGGGSV